MVSEPGCLDEMWTVKMQWDLVDAMFMGVCREKGKVFITTYIMLCGATSAIILLVSPRNSQFNAARNKAHLMNTTPQ